MASAIFGTLLNFLLLMAIIAMVPKTFGHTVYKRSTSDPEYSSIDYSDYPVDNYEKPMQKRAALLLDRLMIALQKAIENEDSVGGGSSGKYYMKSGNQLRESNRQSIPIPNDKTMDLQRRGPAKGRVYWRCYFNAVTCFRRK
ncbi:uncharacterized protein LOC117167630 [Belonocnema kinseyi]|uniref:uncharacterized protein LOC117167630 n=1 Tax=Belonocnema kinseyi TaxID=2817044 RepID=UPI00143DE151|nr:uncharacterized protein LOC117167630 [Belonocnema kinseyi]